MGITSIFHELIYGGAVWLYKMHLRFVTTFVASGLKYRKFRWKGRKINFRKLFIQTEIILRYLLQRILSIQNVFENKFASEAIFNGCSFKNVSKNKFASKTRFNG